jgi:PilZ domain
VIPDTGEVTYLVLADRAVPYLLARVRWPDVAQAITVGCPDWLEDPGLFDLPYDPSAITVSFTQAASVAASWGRQLHAEAADGIPSFIRRMPANWSDLSPAERRAWGTEFVGRRRASARHVRRLRSFRAKIAASSAAAQANGHVGAFAGGGSRPGVDGPASNGGRRAADVISGLGSVATERRRHVRVPVDGLAYIRCGGATISVGLVDLSEGGMRCVLPEARQVLAAGATLDGPFLLEAGVTTSRTCLDVAGWISWHRSIGVGTNFGVVFGELDDGEIEGVQQLLAAACTRRGSR